MKRRTAPSICDLGGARGQARGECGRAARGRRRRAGARARRRPGRRSCSRSGAGAAAGRGPRPRAERMASSRLRSTRRARVRLATLAQAMSSTRATVAEEDEEASAAPAAPGPPSAGVSIARAAGPREGVRVGGAEPLAPRSPRRPGAWAIGDARSDARRTRAACRARGSRRRPCAERAGDGRHVDVVVLRVLRDRAAARRRRCARGRSSRSVGPRWRDRCPARASTRGSETSTASAPCVSSLGTEGAAQERLHLQHVEEVRRHDAGPHAPRLAAAEQGEVHGVVLDDAVERLGACSR